MALRNGAIAVQQEDIGLINAAISEQSRIEAESTGPLQEVIRTQGDFEDMAEQCEAERSSP
jgi:hypothetical protein